MRKFAITSLIVVSVLTGCSANKELEEKLKLAANIFAGYSYNAGGRSFTIEYFETRLEASRKTMYFVDKNTGSSFSLSELADCEFVYRWNTDKKPGDFLFGQTSTVNYSKLNLKAAQFFNSKLKGLGILEIKGIEGAISHSTDYRVSNESELRLSGIPVEEKELYLDRVKTMQEKFCKGRA